MVMDWMLRGWPSERNSAGGPSHLLLGLGMILGRDRSAGIHINIINRGWGFRAGPYFMVLSGQINEE